MPEYALLLYDSPTDSRELSPEEIQAIIERYQAWTRTLEGDGRYVGGHKLRDGQGRVVRRAGGEIRVIDGPYSETKEVIGGIMSIRATDFDEAVRISRECPHLGYGGTIEIREIERD